MQDHLRPAAKAPAFGFRTGSVSGFITSAIHSHNWLVNKRKENPKTVQGILRHGRIQTTLDLYTQADRDEMQAAQGAFLTEMGMGTEAVQ